MPSTVAVLSDVHGVLPALEAVLAEPPVAAADVVVVTGDHTWGPQPAEVLDRLVALDDRAVLVRGNADRELLQMSRGVDVGLGDSRLERWADVLSSLPNDVRTVVCGHTHMPFLRLVDRRLVVNPGSVGLPYEHDGASWALLSGGRVTFGRTALDADRLVAEVVAGSRWSGVDAWADETFRRPASDVDALAAFGPRDGR